MAFVLQSLVAFGVASKHSASTVIDASPSFLSCAEQTTGHRSSVPDHGEGEFCCLFFGACNCHAAQAGFGLIVASLAEWPEFHPAGQCLEAAGGKRCDRPIGWKSSWSPRAPPLFS